mmetsp:Transcript_7380/g.19674  ORF Transcript_7380/g.19674 Transcript_7380/m.19674 type:complete len:121 (+) Transcript_7380:1280-1642(+)
MRSIAQTRGLPDKRTGRTGCGYRSRTFSESTRLMNSLQTWSARLDAPAITDGSRFLAVLELSARLVSLPMWAVFLHERDELLRSLIFFSPDDVPCYLRKRTYQISANFRHAGALKTSFEL